MEPVQELCVTLFIKSIAGYVLRSVGIQVLQSILICILRPRGDAAELRILLPEVCFNQFRGREKLQYGGVTPSEPAMILRKQAFAGECGSAGERSASRESAL